MSTRRRTLLPGLLASLAGLVTWQAFLIFGTLLSVINLTVPETGTGIILLSLTLFGGVAVIIGVRRHRPALVTPWYLISGSLLFQVANSIVYQALDLGPPNGLATATISDLGFLIGTLVQLVAYLQLARHYKRTDCAGTLDALILSVGTGVVLWAFFETVKSSHASVSSLTGVIALSYPALDLFSVFLVLRLVWNVTRPRPSDVLLLLGVLGASFADSFLAFERLDTGFRLGTAFDLGWILFFTAMGAAALHPSIADPPPSGLPLQVRLNRSRFLLLTIAATVSPIILFYEETAVHNGDFLFSEHAALAVVGMLLPVLCLIRMGLVVRDLDVARRDYQLLVDEAPVISYSYGHRESRHGPGFIYISPEVESLLGYSPAQWTRDSGEAWRATIHPDDRASVDSEDDETEISGLAFSQEYRMIAADGRVIWIKDGARLVTDRHGQPLRWHGVMTDITALKEAEQLARTMAEQLQVLFAANPIPTWVYDRETGRVLEANPAALAQYGYERSEALALTIDQIECADQAVATPGTGQLSGLGNDARYRRHRLKDDSTMIVDVTTHDFEYDGHPAVLLIAQDATTRIALEADLSLRAFHDDLTRLANRAHFYRRLDHALASRSPAAGTVAILYLDLDGFKELNDTHGHAAGDEILVHVARQIESAIRHQDLAARLGGDEFAILLTGITDTTQVDTVTNRVAAALVAPVSIAGHELYLTASIGIAIAGAATGSADDLLRVADASMYDAKKRRKSGRLPLELSLRKGA